MNHSTSRIKPTLRNISLALVIVITQSACFLDRSGISIPLSEFSVTPANICPEDPINVSWDIWTTEPCWTGRPVIDTPRCSTINSPASDNTQTPFGPGLDERSGSIDYNPGPTVDTSFSMVALVSSRNGMVRDDLTTSVNVVEVPTSINAIAEGLCADNAGIELTDIISQCVEINQICISSSNPTMGEYVLRGWQECPPGTTPDTCARAAFQSDELRVGECIAPSNVGLTTFQSLRLIDIDWRRTPIGVPTPRSDCLVEGSGFNPPLSVTLQTSCTNAYLGC